jgi:ABC-type sugar transport system ATPase subunit
VWWNVSVVTAGADFVRTAEWRQIRAFAAGIPALEEPAVLTVAGEAGAGKSTLWRAGLAAAEDAGCRVLRSELRRVLTADSSRRRNTTGR